MKEIDVYLFRVESNLNRVLITFWRMNLERKELAVHKWISSIKVSLNNKRSQVSIWYKYKSRNLV